MSDSSVALAEPSGWQKFQKIGASTSTLNRIYSASPFFASTSLLDVGIGIAEFLLLVGLFYLWLRRSRESSAPELGMQEGLRTALSEAEGEAQIALPSQMATRDVMPGIPVGNQTMATLMGQALPVGLPDGRAVLEKIRVSATVEQLSQGVASGTVESFLHEIEFFIKRGEDKGVTDLQRWFQQAIERINTGLQNAATAYADMRAMLLGLRELGLWNKLWRSGIQLKGLEAILLLERGEFKAAGAAIRAKETPEWLQYLFTELTVSGDSRYLRALRGPLALIKGRESVQLGFEAENRTPIAIEDFYIARFPVTNYQWDQVYLPIARLYPYARFVVIEEHLVRLTHLGPTAQSVERPAVAADGEAEVRIVRVVPEDADFAGRFKGIGDRAEMFRSPNHPVVKVSGEEALAYASWTGQLPCGEQHEYVARNGGLDADAYRIGDEVFGTEDGTLTNEMASYGQFAAMGHTQAVGSYPPLPNSVYDIAGNTWELVEDYKFNWTSYYGTIYQFRRGGAWDSPLDWLAASWSNDKQQLAWHDYRTSFRVVVAPNSPIKDDNSAES